MQRPHQEHDTRLASSKIKIDLFSLLAVLSFIGIVFSMLFFHVGGHLKYLYPTIAFIIGLLLYMRAPVFYLGFTWWLFFLTPCIRRVADYQGGWTPENPMMVAPYLVCMISAFSFFKHLKEILRNRIIFPFFLIIIGIIYGFCIGVVNVGLLPAVNGTVEWIAPVFFGFHLVSTWRNSYLYSKAIVHIFTWGLLIIGLYAVVQYYSLFPWDKYWIINAAMGNIGKPEVQHFRLFGAIDVQSRAAQLSAQDNGRLMVVELIAQSSET